MPTQFNVDHNPVELISLYEILDQVSDIVYLMDLDYKIIWANKTLYNILGKESNALIGTFCYKAIYNEDKKCNECPLSIIAKTGESAQGEMSIQGKCTFQITGVPCQR